VSKSETILVRGARQLVTLHGPRGIRRGTQLRDLGVIQAGVMLIRNGVIAAVGSGRTVENLEGARSAAEIDVAGKVVLPGFVDCHTHLGPWCPLLPGARARAAGPASSPALQRNLQHRLRMFAGHGTTTVEAKTGDLKTLQVFGKLDGVLPAVTPTWFLEAGDLPSTAPLSLIRRLARHVDVASGRGGVAIHDARNRLEAARDTGLKLMVHPHDRSPSSGLRLAVECGAASVGHLDGAGQDDVAIMSQSFTIAVLLPGPAFHQGRGHLPAARAWIDSGAGVALATDFDSVTSPSCNMQMMMSLACTHMGMSPAEAVAAATINGAHALGIAGEAGSLETGKSADFTVFDAADYREIPYQFGVNLVTLTVKKGVVLYRQGEVACEAD
jgi:imidazolonepropionase